MTQIPEQAISSARKQYLNSASQFEKKLNKQTTLSENSISLFLEKQGMNAETSDKLFDKYDSNHDGSFDKNELLAMEKEYQKALNSNKNVQDIITDGKSEMGIFSKFFNAVSSVLSSNSDNTKTQKANDVKKSGETLSTQIVGDNDGVKMIKEGNKCTYFDNEGRPTRIDYYDKNGNITKEECRAYASGGDEPDEVTTEAWGDNNGLIGTKTGKTYTTSLAGN